MHDMIMYMVATHPESASCECLGLGSWIPEFSHHRQSLSAHGHLSKTEEEETKGRWNQQSMQSAGLIRAQHGTLRDFESTTNVLSKRMPKY